VTKGIDPIAKRYALKPIVLLTMNTVLRRGEVFNLRWSHVTEVPPIIEVEGPNSKSGQTRHMPLNQEVRAILRQQVAARNESAGLKLLECVVEIASDIATVQVFLLCGIDPLEAVPLADFRTTAALHKARWPQIVAEVGAKRATLKKLTPPVTAR
jgi:integrase